MFEHVSSGGIQFWLEARCLGSVNLRTPRPNSLRTVLFLTHMPLWVHFAVHFVVPSVALELAFLPPIKLVVAFAAVPRCSCPVAAESAAVIVEVVAAAGDFVVVAGFLDFEVAVVPVETRFVLEKLETAVLVALAVQLAQLALVQLAPVAAVKHVPVVVAPEPVVELELEPEPVVELVVELGLGLAAEQRQLQPVDLVVLASVMVVSSVAE